MTFDVGLMLRRMSIFRQELHHGFRLRGCYAVLNSPGQRQDNSFACQRVFPNVASGIPKIQITLEIFGLFA